MLNQQVSMADIDRPDAYSTALSPLPSGNDVRSVDPELKARLMRAAAASDRSSPQVIPGAAVLLLALDLPLKTDRKRRTAAAYAAEPFLVTGLDETHVAVGPLLRGSVRLCAAIDRNDPELQTGGDWAVLPDLCAVPMPLTPEAWSLWCSPYAVYIRTADGGGCVVDIECFADLWRAFDRPHIDLWHGTPPPGIDIGQHHAVVPKVDASTFDLDMRPGGSHSLKQWRRHLNFAVGVGAFAGMAHAALLVLDARALDRATADRRVALIEHASDRGISLDLTLPTPVITTDLMQRARPATSTDPLLRLLARTGDALSGTDSIAFRDLRYDASVGTLTILISAPDLAALQRAEYALRTGSMTVASGAASTGASGAEMQLALSEAT